MARILYYLNRMWDHAGEPGDQYQYREAPSWLLEEAQTAARYRAINDTGRAKYEKWSIYGVAVDTSMADPADVLRVLEGGRDINADDDLTYFDDCGATVYIQEISNVNGAPIGDALTWDDAAPIEFERQIVYYDIDAEQYDANAYGDGFEPIMLDVDDLKYTLADYYSDMAGADLAPVECDGIGVYTYAITNDDGDDVTRYVVQYDDVIHVTRCGRY